MRMVSSRIGPVHADTHFWSRRRCQNQPHAASPTRHQRRKGIFYFPLRRLRQMTISRCCIFQCYGPNFGTKAVLDMETDLSCFFCCISCRTCRDDPWLVPSFCHTRPYREPCNSSWDTGTMFFRFQHISCSFPGAIRRVSQQASCMMFGVQSGQLRRVGGTSISCHNFLLLDDIRTYCSIVAF